MVALSESFYIFLTTTSAGILLACLKLAYDSKCKNLDLCCIKIVRDTGAEIEAEQNRLDYSIANPVQQIERNILRERPTESLDRPI